MLSVVVGGRLVQNQFVQVSPNKIVFPLSNATEIANVCVFLNSPLPEGSGAVIYIGWPSVNGSYQNWQFLGYISNVQPSGIYKIVPQKNPELTIGPDFGKFHHPQENIMAQIGVELGDLKAIEHQYGRKDPNKVVSDKLEFAKKMATSLFEYIASFQGTNYTFKQEPMVPLSLVEKWYTNFENKLKNNPDFWKQQ
uniref:Uncharacterized protein n=1 Tax=Arcella intermedia TaxID=1963864 RepID=A0A6B2LKJ8_9EUKA